MIFNKYTEKSDKMFPDKNQYFNIMHESVNSTNTSRVFHVQTTWERPFPHRFNMEYKWCVWREDTISLLTIMLFLQSFTKYSRQTLIFLWNRELRKKFKLFFFFEIFCLYWQDCQFWEEDWALDYSSVLFWDFPDIF